MTVVYYTQTYFLDAALETIQSLKKIATLHLLIELAPESRTTTIIDIPSLKGFDVIENFKDVVDEKTYSRFLPYLDGIASVNFFVQNTRRAFSPLVFYKCRKVIGFINRISPDVIHFDTVSARSIGLVGLTNKYKILITVHDPVPHTGETSWKKLFTTLLFYRKARNFFFYSKFAQGQFASHYPKLKKKTSLLCFQPFSYIRQFSLNNNAAGDYILFFGRISPYKGIDILIGAIPLVLKRFPETRFIIAGSQANYSLKTDSLLAYKDSTTVISRHLSTEELSGLIVNSKFIVCPYRDATQSGVLMTASAFGKPVLATRVGAFPEFIFDGYNGLLTEPTPVSFATAICTALSGDKYLQFAQHVTSSFSHHNDEINQVSLLTAYKK